MSFFDVVTIYSFGVRQRTTSLLRKHANYLYNIYTKKEM